MAKLTLSPEEQSYLGKCDRLEESDPGILITWHDGSVDGFVAAANGILPPGIGVPPFLQMPMTSR
jgi:hypothetical protein